MFALILANYGDNRRSNVENNVDSQWQSNDQQQQQQKKLRNQEPKQTNENSPRENVVNLEDAGKNANKLDMMKPSSPEDDDEGKYS